MIPTYTKEEALSRLGECRSESQILAVFKTIFLQRDHYEAGAYVQICKAYFDRLKLIKWAAQIQRPDPVLIIDPLTLL